MKIADFFAAIGFDIDDKALGEVNKKLESVQKNTLKLTGLLSAAVYAMDRFAASSIKGAVALTNFNLQTGLSTEKLQHWQAAAQLENMATSAEEVAASIQSLQQNLTQIRLGTGNAAPFQLLGIDIKGRDAFDVLDQLREKIKGLSPSLATNMMEQMGLSPNFINIMRLSREEFDRLGKSLVRSKRTTDSIIRIGKAIKELKLSFLKFKDDMVAKLEPFFMSTIAILRRMGHAVDNIITFLDKFPMLSKAAAAGLTLLLVPLRALRLLISPLAVTLGALFLLLEDLAVYAQGGKSVIGKVLAPIEDGFERIKKLQENIEKKGIVKGFTDSLGEQIQRNVTVEKMAPADSWWEGFKRLLPSISINNPATQEGGVSNNTKSTTNTFNNSFIINNEEGVGVAKGIADTLQRQLNYGVTDMNNGAAY